MTPVDTRRLAEEVGATRLERWLLHRGVAPRIKLGWINTFFYVVGVGGIIEGYRTSSPFLVVVSVFLLTFIQSAVNESTLTRIIEHQQSQIEKLRRRLEERRIALFEEDESES